MNEVVFELLDAINQKHHELNKLYLQLARVGAVANSSESEALECAVPAINKRTRLQEQDAAPVCAVPFYVTLLSHQNKESKLAELARQVANDDSFPRDANISEMVAYLRNNPRYPDKASQQLRMAYASHVKQLKKPVN